MLAIRYVDGNLEILSSVHQRALTHFEELKELFKEWVSAKSIIDRALVDAT